jgi:hypothetical protein
VRSDRDGHYELNLKPGTYRLVACTLKGGREALDLLSPSQTRSAVLGAAGSVTTLDVELVLPPD